MKQVIGVAPQVNAYFWVNENPGYHCVVSDRWIDTKTKRLDDEGNSTSRPLKGHPLFPADVNPAHPEAHMHRPN